MHHADINHSLHAPPTKIETLQPIIQLSRGKALGSDVIPVEFYKDGDAVLADTLTLTLSGFLESRIPFSGNERCVHSTPLQKEKKSTSV